MTRILVVGAGAIGGYFGGRMLEAGADVTFLVRARRAAQLAERGLVIRSPRGDVDRSAPPTVTADTIAAPFDAIVLSCKAFDLAEAMDSFAPAVGPDTRIMPLLNGMAHMDALSARFGTERVLGGQCQISTTLEPDGAIRHFGEMQALSLGERENPPPGEREDRPPGEREGAPSPVTQALAAALASCGGRISETIEQDMWEKWAFITTIAAITCLFRGSTGDVVAAGGVETARAIATECMDAVAHAGHPVRPAMAERLRTVVSTPGLPFTASMLRDIERGGRVEADQLLGDLIARGPADLPLLRLAYLHLKTYAARREREG